MKRVLTVLLVVAGLFAGVMGYLWNKTPPDNAVGTSQITGGCCSNVPWGHMVSVRDAAGVRRATVEFENGHLTVEGDAVSIEFGVKSYLDGEEVVDGDREFQLVVYDETVTMEIVAIHDAIFDRNDAVDIRFTYVPPPSEDGA